MTVVQSSVGIVNQRYPSLSFSPHSSIWNVIWEAPCFPKIRQFLWCCVFDALSLRLAL
ncbi:hypothetical protein LguiA_001330 [Lonicera macranthoides]